MALFGNEESLSIVVRLRDEATKHLQAMQVKFEHFNDRMQASASASRTFALGLAGVGTAIGGLGVMAIQAAADMEQTRVSFETMLGSAEKADSFIRDLVNFAKTTPFELKGLEQASKQLLAYGFSQQEVIPNLKALGDITAGVGADKLPQLILAFGQVKAATKLTGMELRQFTEAGVPLLDQLAKQMGVTVAEVQKMVSEGTIGFPAVQKALMDLTGEGGRFNNLMQNQSQTLNGMISNLKDAWDIFLRGEGQKLLEWAKAFIALAIDIIQNHLPGWINRIDTLVQWLGQHKEVLIIVAGAMMGALIPAVYAAIVAFGSFALALAPFLIGGAIVGGIVAGIIWIVQNWDMMKTKVTAILEAIKVVFVEVWQGIKDTVRDTIDYIERQVDRIVDAYQKVRNLVTAPIRSVANSVSGSFNWAADALGFEHGGTVPGARGMPVPIMAHGQEEIIPAGQKSRGSSAVYVTINNPTVRSDDDLDRITRQIERVFRGLMVNHKLPAS